MFSEMLYAHLNTDLGNKLEHWMKPGSKSLILLIY